MSGSHRLQLHPENARKESTRLTGAVHASAVFISASFLLASSLPLVYCDASKVVGFP